MGACRAAGLTLRLVDQWISGCQRKRDGESVALPKSRACPLHKPAMMLNDLCHDGRTQPQPTCRIGSGLTRLHKRLEQLGYDIRIHADAVVAHRDHRLALGPVAQREQDAAAWVGISGSVVQKIGENLDKPEQIVHALHGRRAKVIVQRMPLLDHHRLALPQGLLEHLGSLCTARASAYRA